MYEQRIIRKKFTHTHQKTILNSTGSYVQAKNEEEKENKKDTASLVDPPAATAYPELEASVVVVVSSRSLETLSDSSETYMIVPY